MTIFKRELKPFQRYQIRSRILGWNEKWLFVLSRFEFSDRNKTLAAIALSKYVFKFNKVTIPPEEAIKICGLDTPENLEAGRIDFEKAKKILEIESQVEVSF
jgi:hypothetical protein